MVRLMCSGRSLYFKRFINLFEMDKPDKPLDFSDMSDEDIINELGLPRDAEMLEESGD